MKKAFIGVLASLTALSMTAATVFAAGPGNGPYFTDADNDGICDYAVCAYEDADGDGICDHYASGQCQGGGRGRAQGGRGYGCRGGHCR